MTDLASLPPEVLAGLWRADPVATARKLSRGAYQRAPHLELIASKVQELGWRTLRLILTAPPRHGKPLDVETLILMGDGSRRRLADVVVGDQVISHTGARRRVDGVFDQGELECLRIRTDAGREVVAASDHPFLTPAGWRLAGELVPGVALANVPTPAISPLRDRSNDEFRLAGYFTGDGSTGATRTSCNAAITNMDPHVIADLHQISAALGFRVRERVPVPVGGRPANRASAFEFSGGVRPWLVASGLAGLTSKTKHVPSWVFRASGEQIGHFLAAYFACDGTVNQRGQARKDCAVEFYSISRPLLEGVQHLLLRLGVASRLTLKLGRYDGRRHESWRLTITSQDHVARFVAAVPVIGTKLERLHAWGYERTAFDAPLLADRIVAVEPTGLRPCRCIKVADDHTYTANDFVVHNTEIISRWTPVWFLENWPDRDVIGVSYGADLALDSGRQVRNTLEERRDLLTVRLRDDSAAAHRFDTTRGGGMRTAGVGGPITGRGADLLIVDDYLKNAAEAESKHARDAVWRWWRGTARTRLEPGGSVIILATRWHEDDLIGRLLAGQDEDDEHADEWEIVNLPAVAEPGDALSREPGAPLWPARYDAAALAAIRSSIGSYNWAAQYQQRPSPEEGRLVMRDWWARYDPDDLVHWDGSSWRPRPGVSFDDACLSWDMAFKATSDTDFVVGEAWARKGPNAYLLDVVRGRWSFTETVARFRDQTRAWPWIQARLVEEKANGAAVIDTLKSEISGLISVNPKDSKVARVNGASPWIEAGNVWVPHDSARRWAAEFVDEWAGFPNAANDDQVDAGTQALERLMRRTAATTVSVPEHGGLPRVAGGASSPGRPLAAVGGGRRLPRR